MAILNHLFVMEKNGKILIIDDDEGILLSARVVLKRHFGLINILTDPELIPSTLAGEQYDVVLLDMNFSIGKNTGSEGLYWLKRIKKTNPEVLIILITAYGSIELAVRSLKEGAYDFITKPWENDRLLTTLFNAVKLRKSRDELNNMKEKQKHLNFHIGNPRDNLIGSNKSMLEIFNTISKVANTDANILITGENGTGKELVAREIHLQSNRNTGSFIQVDIASLSETILESELFGHIKGAYTDAATERIGRFELASGGTLFLDEIGNVNPSTQVRILTALQNREITPIGSNDIKSIDIRLIAATNKNLDHLTKEGLFRDDLLYRINTITIEIPPLRERKDDIPVLATYFLKHYCEKYEKPGLRMNNNVFNHFSNHNWPGNIRELKHSVERAVILSSGKTLKPEDFVLKNSIQLNEKKLSLRLADVEKKTIIAALEKHKRNLTKTAMDLDISRTTLYQKIEKYDL